MVRKVAHHLKFQEMSSYYTQTKKTMHSENISGMFIMFWPITFETLQP